MSYRDILVVIDERPEASGRAQTAANLARSFQAPLTGAFLKSAFPQDAFVGSPLAYFPPADLGALIEQHAASVDRAAEAARETFERAAAEAGVASDWRTLEGPVDAALIQYARRFDLVICPPTIDVSLSQHKLSAGGLALESGGPVLVTPDEAPPSRIGRKVLVAWNGSRESARALRDAWPLIQAAEEVHVLVVSPKGEGGADGLLQRHFERHDRPANLIIDFSDDATASQLIRQHVRTLNADLLVMGLYGRSRLQELILGGVSRDLLREPPIPLLVSH